MAITRSAAPRALAVAGALLALAPASAGAVAQILPGQAGLGDFDGRIGRVEPTSAQRQGVTALGARVQWNRYGTPASLIDDDGFLTDARAGSAADVARGFIRDNRELFRRPDRSPRRPTRRSRRSRRGCAPRPTPGCT
jgi:hypothetical protein